MNGNTTKKSGGKGSKKKQPNVVSGTPITNFFVKYALLFSSFFSETYVFSKRTNEDLERDFQNSEGILEKSNRFVISFFSLMFV